jgi:hypothetical protein
MLKSKIILPAGFLLTFLIYASPVFAQEMGSYPNGSEGIKVASLPPPGFYWRNYFSYYSANEIMDNNGNEAPIGFKANVFAWTQRIVWVTDMKVLGGNYGINFLLPLLTKNISIQSAGISDSRKGFGDIVIDQVLGWSGERYIIPLAFAITFPTGKYDKTKPGLPGQNFYTYMFTLGISYDLNDGKDWTFSILSRYEIHSKKGSEDVIAGNDFHFEWSLSRNFERVWDVGIVGFCQWQVTDDKGKDAISPSVHDRSFAIGPEVDLLIPSFRLIGSLHFEKEFGVIDRPQGSMLVMTLTKIL